MRGGRTIAALSVVVAAMSAQPAASTAPVPLSLREKVGQMVMFGLGGKRLTTAEKDLIERHALGGVILFAHNYRDRTQLEALTSQIQRVARRSNARGIGALISVDQEGGIVKRFPDMPPWYSHPELGARNDRALAYQQGRTTGHALAAAGVNMNLAPVADLDLPPEHVMRSRSFGRKPRRVARLATAFAKGLQSKRVVATLKHFPGLGGATINSDYGKAYVYRSRSALRSTDGRPFRRAIERGVRAVMLSHGIYVHLPGNGPASLNRRISTRELRRRYGFKGVAISDALGAVAWRYDGDIAETCKATVAAGADIALLSSGVSSAVTCAKAIRAAVRSGSIPAARIDRSLSRILTLKQFSAN